MVFLSPSIVQRRLEYSIKYIIKKYRCTHYSPTSWRFFDTTQVSLFRCLKPRGTNCGPSGSWWLCFGPASMVDEDCGERPTYGQTHRSSWTGPMPQHLPPPRGKRVAVNQLRAHVRVFIYLFNMYLLIYIYTYIQENALRNNIL